MNSYLGRLVESYVPPSIPELFVSRPPATARHGVGVVVLDHQDTPAAVAEALLRFAFVHYARVGFINEALAERETWVCEPPATLNPRDRHVAVGDTRSGELLAYATLKAPVDRGRPFASGGRAWFSVERAYGRDLFDSLKWLQEVAVEEVREVGRVVRSAYLGRSDLRATRASSELLLACMREILDPGNRVSAVVGDGEPEVMIKNIRLLGASLQLVEGRSGRLPDSHIYAPRYAGRNVVPFAFSVAGVDRAKVRAVEQALSADDSGWRLERDRLRSRA